MIEKVNGSHFGGARVSAAFEALAETIFPLDLDKLKVILLYCSRKGL